MDEYTKTVIYHMSVYLVCLVALLFHGDWWLFVFSTTVFLVTGVPWELQHRKDWREFNGERMG
jgi:hypothetical protein